METTSTLALTGYAGMIAVIATALFQLARFLLDRRRAASEDRHDRNSDAASLLTAQQAALNSERDENARLRDRVGDLEDTVDKLRGEVERQRRRHRREIDEMRTEHEQELATLRAQLVAAIGRLDEMQQRLSGTTPEGDA